MTSFRSREVLTDAQRDAVIRDYQAGVGIKVIADRYGISPAYPGLLARRRGKTLRNGPSACPHCGKRFR